MLREATNRVIIKGILSENNLKYGSFVDKNTGKNIDVINGNLKVLVDQTINGVPETSEIEVDFFSQKYKKGTMDINPSYASIERAMNEMVSIAACGDKDRADRISIGGARLSVNYFVGRDGSLCTSYKVGGSFVERVTGKFEPMTKFVVEGVIASKIYAVDKEGNELEPKKLIVNAVIPGWAGKVQVIPFVTENPAYIDTIEQSWELNKTVEIRGKLSFTSSTEIIKKSFGFGDPEEFVRTHTTKDFVITGGSEEPYPEETEFPINEVRTALAELKAYKEDVLRKGARPAKPAPAMTNSRNDALDLGF